LTSCRRRNAALSRHGQMVRHGTIGRRRAPVGIRRRFVCGGVVQLVRTPACQAGGRRFESRRSRQSFDPKNCLTLSYRISKATLEGSRQSTNIRPPADTETKRWNRLPWTKWIRCRKQNFTIFQSAASRSDGHCGTKSANTNPSRWITSPVRTAMGPENTGASYTNV
jgi:hypothetical protein